VRTIERLHAEHDASATPLQRVIDRMTNLTGRPAFIVGLTAVLALWIAGNLALRGFGLRPLDQPPFNALQTIVSMLALYVTVTILATQRRADQLASRREQLTLELAIIAERKTAKIIALIEELRRDHPELENRVDDQAIAMSAPAGAQAVLDAIEAAKSATAGEGCV
jgi:uncharacterized membrane protein